MFKRALESVLRAYATQPVVAILGPRQSGKTTLAKSVFATYRYVSFEDPQIRAQATADPRKFLRLLENDHGVLIDEAQYVPEIFSYIQLEVDEKKRPGYFVITGSQNFLLNANITQSLAGRVGIVTLLPLTLSELANNALLTHDLDLTMFNGGYPRIYTESAQPAQLYADYIQTYLERDVRQLANVGDLHDFQKFMRLCASRVSGLLDLSNLANDAGVSVPTVKRWISLLEASYIIFLTPPFHKSYGRRMTKSPKLHFYDVGLVCYLLEIESADVLARHPLRGGIFENFIMADLRKQYHHIGKRPPLYFWRDLNGRIEVDAIIEQALSVVPIEIKSGETARTDMFKGVAAWATIADIVSPHRYVVYGGKESQTLNNGFVISWHDAGSLVERVRSQTE